MLENYKVKTIFTLIITIAFYYSILSQTPVEIHGSLSVSGNKIVNKDGDVASFAGNSLFWSNNGWGGEAFYNLSVVSKIKSDWNATIVRAAMGVDENGGYITHPENKQKVITVVDAAIDQGLYVIIDWHSHHAEDYQEEAITFFSEMATLYNEHDNVIYEIYNEPLNNVSWPNTIKPYSEAVISAIRAIDPDNLIVVGSSSWSQDVDVASLDPITGYSNIAYTLHFYAGTHGESLRNKAQTALDNGIALMVTEWGTVNANGDGAVSETSVNQWMDFLCENNISHCNWALNDKVEGASVLKSGSSSIGNWASDDLTASGILVKDIIENWNSNCSIISNVQSDPEESGIELYPNPVTDLLFTKVSAGLQISSIIMMDSLGEIVLEINNPKTEINVSSLNSGLYIINLRTSKGQIVKNLIIE
jgi:hypothetical protein